MGLVPRLLGIALAALVLTGSGGAAFAADTLTASADVIASLPPSSSMQESLLPAGDKFDPASQAQRSDVQSGGLDFFSVRPEVRSGDFTSLLGSSTGGGGLKLHFNW